VELYIIYIFCGQREGQSPYKAILLTIEKTRPSYKRVILIRGVQKKPKPKNRRNRTEKPVNRKKFPKKSVRLTEPEKSFGFWFGYDSGGSKIRLTGG